jgi:hypothetical protein
LLLRGILDGRLWHSALVMDKPRNAVRFHPPRLRPSGGLYSPPVYLAAAYPKQSRRA